MQKVKLVFVTQIISRWQKNADAKVVLSTSRQQIWNLCWQFSKICIFPNIQLKGVVNRLPPFKDCSDHTSIFLMEYNDNRKIKHHITYLQDFTH